MLYTRKFKRRRYLLWVMADIVLLAMGVLTCCSASSVPVICYHAISPHPYNEMMTTPENFESHIRYLKENGFHTLTMDEMVAFMEGKKIIPPKSIVLTFDDGYAGVYRYAYPILKRNEYHAVLFLVVGAIGKPGDKMEHLTWEEVAEMDRSGVIEAQVHCNQLHVRMAEYWEHEARLGKPHSDLERDLRDAKATLEAKLHKKVLYLAWPFGDYNRPLIHMALRLGYRALVATGYGVNRKGDSILRIRRIRMSTRYDTLARFRRKLTLYRIL